MANTFDAIIIGTGQAGPFLAQRLTAAGMKVAIIEPEAVWRNLCEYGLHPNQNHGGKRLCRPRDASRCRVRHRGAHGCEC